MDIQLILEISAIATIISAGISYITFRKSSSLTYVTQERKEWREAIRRIAEELEKCSYKKRKKVLVQLKTRINAYGLNSKNELNDMHIWKQIQKIEACKEEEYDDLKNQLIIFLSLLLKYDWERSKKEVYGEPIKFVGYVVAVVALVFLSIGLLPKAGGDIATFIPLIFMLLLMIVGSMLILSLGKKAARASATLEVLVYAVTPIILLFIATMCIRRGIVPLEDNSYIEVSLVAGLLAGFLQFLMEFIEWSNKKLYQYSVRKLAGQTKNGGNFLRRVGDRWKQRNTIMGQHSNIWSWLTIAVILSVPQIVLFAGIQHFISESIGSAERLSLHIATGSLSVTVIIALLVYWLQKSDAGKEQLHRQRAAMTSMRYAIENGICWMIGANDDILGAAATIKEIVNQYRQELLDVLTEQEYNEMILVVEGINDAIAASRNEDVDACVTENNRAKMFRPWINTIRWSRYRSYLAMTEDYHDLLSEMMINLLNALGGTYTFEYKMCIRDKNRKCLLELNGERITIHQGEELILDGSFDVDESAGFAGFVDGWAKDDEYIGFYAEGMRNGKGCSYGCHGEKLKEGIWEKGELKNGIEYACLIHVEQGSLIFNPEGNDYDASDDFEYSVYEQYGMNTVPFMNSETYIEHYHLADCYVADRKVDSGTGQLVNIRTLEQYLEKKNPKRLQDLKEMMELENRDEDDSM